MNSTIETEISMFISHLEKLNIEKKENEEVEMEARFGVFTKKNKFEPGFNKDVYERVYNFLMFNFSKNHYKNYQIISYSEDNKLKKIESSLIDTNIKINIKQEELKENSITTFQVKERKNVYNFPNYPIRLSSSIEKEVKDQEVNQRFIVNRSRCRDSFIVNENISFDLDTYLIPFDDTIYYSCEIEFKFDNNVYDIQQKRNIVLGECLNMLKIIQNVELVIDEQESHEALKQYTKLTTKKYFIGNQPETISLDKIQNDTSKEFAITEKLDGKRNLLLINDKGYTYLIDNHLNILKFNIKFTASQCFNTIIDGEYFNGNYYSFDIIYSNNASLYNNINYGLKERLDLLHATLDMNNFKFIENTTCKIFVKNYYFDTLYNSFCLLTEKYKEHLINGSIDGLIIVGTDHSYSKKNVAYKWKPDQHNTIDFKIKKISDWSDPEYDTWELYCSEGILFTDNKYCKTRIVKSISDHYNNDSIVEFYFDKKLDCFVPLRTREDKTKGNHLSVALDNWETIKNPLQIKDLKGLEENKSLDGFIPPYIKDKLNKDEIEFFNMRRFHNWTKRVYLNKYTRGLRNTSLLDLASGKGGDLKKWIDSGIKYVEGYDICQNSIQEALKRYNSLQEKDLKRIKVSFDKLDLSSECMDFNKKFDIITCHFAIHYFFETNEKINNIIDTMTTNLEENGVVIITFMEGSRVENFIESNLSNKNSSIEYTNNKDGINVFIKDSVLNEPRKEYLVYTKKIQQIFQDKGLECIDQEDFKNIYLKWKELSETNGITPQEKNISFLNKVMVFRKNTEIISNPVVEPKQDLTRTSLNKLKLKELKDYCEKNNIQVKQLKKDIITEILNQQKNGKVL